MGLLVPAPIAKDEAERIVQDKLRWILGSSDPMAVIVFGSAARDEMTERSDIDLALIYPDEASLKAGRRAIHGQNPAGSWPADLLFYTKDVFLRKRESGGVCELIGKEGRVIHGGLG